MAVKRNRGIPFGSVITGISRGIQLTAEQLGRCLTDKETGYRYLSLADIKEGFSFELNTEELRHFDPSKINKDVRQFCVRPNMILLTKNDTPFKVQIAGSSVAENVIVGGNIYMISVDEEKLIPRWLCYWLQGDEGMARLRSAASLTNNGKMRWISIKQVEGVMIPDISFQQQANLLVERINEFTRWVHSITLEIKRNSREILSILDSLGIPTRIEGLDQEKEE